MSIRVVAKSLYGFFGVLFLVAGAGVLLLRSGLLPGAVRSLIDGFGEGDSNTLHIIQELGSCLVFIGLITLWFIKHYEQSLAFHWAMTVFWGLIAWVHWFDVRGPWESVSDPLINTIPFLIFALVGLLRLTTEHRPGSTRPE